MAEREESRPMVQTVLGPVPADELGIVMPHEHILWDGVLAGGPGPVDDDEGRALAREPVRLDTLWWVRQNYTRSFDDIVLLDEDLAAAELRRYRQVGGGTVVEATPAGLSRSPEGLARISRASGVHIVMGSGYY